METNIYLQIIKQLPALSEEEKKKLYDELSKMVHMRANRPKRSILELRGLGMEIWNGIDVDEYISKERESWNR